MDYYTINTDGGSRSNPGKAAIGIVLKDPEGKVIERISKFIGIQTNNFAEYEALIQGLKLAISKDIKNLKCILDSELVVKQVKGLYKVKEPVLQQKHKEVLAITKSFNSVIFVHVLRAENKDADLLVNKALDEVK